MEDILKKKVQPRIYKGTRDFLPEQMVKRQHVINTIKQVFEKYGFEPLETPTIELWETLAGKYGEEGDRLTYRFTDRGNREVGLRYDLTVPLSRVIAMYPQIPKPFKRYQIQPVWRADKPQKGRFREFYQCDVDIVGSKSVLADAEILAVLYEALITLGFEHFTMRINSRKILSGIAEISGVSHEKELDICRAIDKFDKIGMEGVKTELESREIPASSIEKISKILTIAGTNEERLGKISKLLVDSPIGLEGVKEVKELFNYLQGYEIPEEFLLFDLTLARGLDYYTGPIFETVVDKPRIGSITGGGRYDRLIGLFTGREEPATGSSIGLERIVTVMDELNMFPEDFTTPIKVLVTVFDEDTLNYSIQIAKMLRSAGIPTDLYTGTSKIRGQFGLANDKKIPIVIVAGSNEIETKSVNIKNMQTGDQQTVSLSELVNKVQNVLNKEVSPKD